MKITIYGADGCSTCSNLKERTEEVVENRGFDAEVEKVTGTAELASKGLMATPAFEVDSEMVFQGSDPSRERIEEILEERL
ncbi:MAG: MTH895/ArsE family thioredoxin-like protein [Candidatus Nanohaloarchaeota archaeon QJJ-7]|nr:MTH895/ArsE family thioredoxin-like protein [Candidatus Nanohaloarchaeota archaeon QJJ-7]